VGVPFAKGHDPRRGHGLPGRTGVKTASAWRAKLLALLHDPTVEQSVRIVLADPDHPHFAAVYRTVGVQAAGNPLNTSPLPAPEPDGTRTQVHVYLPDNSRRQPTAMPQPTAVPEPEAERRTA